MHIKAIECLDGAQLTRRPDWQEEGDHDGADKRQTLDSPRWGNTALSSMVSIRLGGDLKTCGRIFDLH